MITKEYLHTHVHNTLIHNSQEVETTPISIKGWVDKWNVAYPYNTILFSLKILTQATMWMNLWGHYAKWNRPVFFLKTNAVWVYSYEIFRAIKLIDRMYRAVPGAGERGAWGVSVSWVESLFCRMKRILWMDGVDDCKIVWMYSMPLNCTLKND